MKTSELWVIVEKLYQENNSFPTIAAIASAAGCSEDIVRQGLQYFAEKELIEQRGNRYIMRVKAPPAKEAQKKEVIIERNNQNWGSIITQGIMIVIGLLCVFVSMRYTAKFNLRSLPTLWAYILSFCIVIFAAFSFTARAILKSQGNIAAGRTFLALWIVCISYSISTAVAGQYDSYLTVTAEAKSHVSTQQSNTNEVEIIQSQIDALQLEQRALQSQREHHLAIIADLSTSPERKVEYPVTWKESNAAIEAVTQSINTITNSIASLQERIIALSRETNTLTQTDNFYQYLSRILWNIDPLLLQFFIALFPAIFIDLIAPIALSFGLTLNLHTSAKTRGNNANP